MNVFDIMGLASKVPYELVQKLEADVPKLTRLAQLIQQAEPHVNALIPIANEAERVYNQISPDILQVLNAFRSQA